MVILTFQISEFIILYIFLSILGGTSNWNATIFLNDVAVLDTSIWQWSIPTITGTPPSVRWGHNANYALGQMVIAFGRSLKYFQY